MNTTSHFRVAVLGAGLSGLCMGIRLRESGLRDFIILEKADRVGGTWRENSYPGVACDVPSHLYSFSFELNPSWTRVYSSGAEIQAYCEHCAKKYGLDEQLRFDAKILEVSFEDPHWRIELAGGQQVTADVVVSALGGLHIPNIPPIEGLERFEGRVFHSAEWDHDYDLRDKRVAVIGTGASAIQIVPEIAKQVSQLRIFQRTPGWVVPRWDGAYSEFSKKWMRRLPLLGRLRRWLIYSKLESRGMLMIRKSGWVGRWLQGFSQRFLSESVDDPETAARLAPNFPIGCKRILISDDYYSTFNEAHVSLESQPIATIEHSGIRTCDGRSFELDAIILATGFRPFDVTSQLAIRGRDGLDLGDAWKQRIESYRTVMVPRFPNFFLLLGPNSGLGHNSIILMIEAQVRYVLGCLDLMRRRDAKTLEPLPESARSFNQRVQAGLLGTVFSGSCNAWYTDDNGHNFTLWPWSTLRYWAELRKPREKELELGS